MYGPNTIQSAAGPKFDLPMGRGTAVSSELRCRYTACLFIIDVFIAAF